METVKNSKELIQEIHTLFDTASDRLTKQAQDIINEGLTMQTSKAARLERLGFAVAKPVKDCNGYLQRKWVAEDLLKTIEYCRMVYPLYKFITDDEVTRICQKYSLTLGDAFKYIGDIPEKNLCEIEAFRLKKEDAPATNQYPLSIEDVMFGNVPTVNIQSRRTGSMERWSAALDVFNRGMIEQRKYALESEMPKEPEVKPHFKIVAPITDFNVRPDDRIYEHRLVDDPVVLCPIRNGYLVISKWGLEASDPILLNEQSN